MGNSIVQPREDRRCGFRVLEVLEKSPASKAKLEPYFDVLVSINGEDVSTMDEKTAHDRFFDIVKENDQKMLPIVVENVLRHTIRDAIIQPDSSWQGQGSLGCTIRFSSIDHNHTHALRVLNVTHGSPASLAGLKPFSDYILGTPRLAFGAGEPSLREILDDSAGKVTKLVVYNAGTCSLRKVKLLRSDSSTNVGCEVGTGALHRPPFALRGSGKHDMQSALGPSQVARAVRADSSSLQSAGESSDDEPSLASSPAQSLHVPGGNIALPTFTVLSPANRMSSIDETTGAKESLPVIPMSEVRRHDSRSSCWVVVCGKVYDLTEFIQRHPPGLDIILRRAGGDVTADFEEVHHSASALRMLDGMCVGVTARAPSASAVTAAPAAAAAAAASRDRVQAQETGASAGARPSSPPSEAAEGPFSSPQRRSAAPPPSPVTPRSDSFESSSQESGRFAHDQERMPAPGRPADPLLAEQRAGLDLDTLGRVSPLPDPFRVASTSHRRTRTFDGFSPDEFDDITQRMNEAATALY